jgi:hypothetical protein
VLHKVQTNRYFEVPIEKVKGFTFKFYISIPVRSVSILMPQVKLVLDALPDRNVIVHLVVLASKENRTAKEQVEVVSGSELFLLSES